MGHDPGHDDDITINRAGLERLQRLASLGQVGASTIHEVRNAMTGILGFAQVAQRRLDDRVALGEMVAMIERESLRCLDLLTAFLSRVRGGASRRQTIDVSDVVKGVERIVRERFQDRGIRLRCELGGDLPPVSGDADALRQVVLNLTVNALQASTAGAEVVLRTRAAEGGVVEIDVEDQGEGVPEELRERIFEPFFTTRGEEGTGLGLWISRSIVADHGGALSLEPSAGRGSRFLVRLPQEVRQG